jgi:hypothetical protein
MMGFEGLLLGVFWFSVKAGWHWHGMIMLVYYIPMIYRIVLSKRS